MDRIITRIKRLAARVLFFSVITMALRGVREWLGNIIKASPEATAAIAKLKGALLTMVQPLVNVIIPAFTTLVNILTRVVTAIAQFTSMLAGTTLAESAASAEALNEETTALKETGAAAKKATKQLAAFDEINKLSSSDSDGGAGGSSGISADFSALKGLETQEYKNKIDEITAYASGALLALGVILTFSGANIPLGIGLIAAGAVGLAAVIHENWGSANDKVKEAINNVLTTLGGAGFVLGAMLAFSGASLPLGIGLMLMGAASLGVAVALNWDAVKTALQGPIGNVVAIVSGSLLALGAIFAFSGVALPLGIALMAAGAIGLATVTALNWSSLTGYIKDNLTKILTIGGTSLLALGLILALSGVALPLGIALIVAGAAGLVTAAALNWNAILEKLKGAWANIKSWWRSSVVPALTSVVRWFADKILNPMLTEVEGFINFFIKGINWLIDRLNSIQISLPDWIPGIGGNTYGINIPNVSEIAIPRLATGAVIPPNREFLAVLGDQKSGNNLEMPEALLRRIIREEGGSGGGTFNIIVELDGEVVYRNQQKVARRHGFQAG